MEPINGLNQLATILRQKLAEKAEYSPIKKDAPQSTSSRPSPKIDSQTLQRQISEKLSAIPKHTRTDTKATKVFVEAVLQWEFGDELLNDNQLETMTLDIIKSMQTTPAIWGKMQTLIGSLEKQ